MSNWLSHRFISITGLQWLAFMWGFLITPPLWVAMNISTSCSPVSLNCRLIFSYGQPWTGGDVGGPSAFLWLSVVSPVWPPSHFNTVHIALAQIQLYMSNLFIIKFHSRDSRLHCHTGALLHREIWRFIRFCGKLKFNLNVPSLNFILKIERKRTLKLFWLSVQLLSFASYQVWHLCGFF